MPDAIPSAELETAVGFASAQVVLKPRKALPFFARHPWVFDSAIADVIGSPRNGDVVDLLSEKQRFIARGIFNSNSRLRVRLFTWDHSQPLVDEFWRQKIVAAIELRKDLGLLETNRACRLVFSEADGISGLVVDRYADFLVVQINSLAMAVRQTELINMLAEVVRPRGILVRGEKGISREEGIEIPSALAWGESPPGPIFIQENGLQLGIDLTTGQKTGFYLDQAENRLAAARYLASGECSTCFATRAGSGWPPQSLAKRKMSWELIQASGRSLWPAPIPS